MLSFSPWPKDDPLYCLPGVSKPNSSGSGSSDSRALIMLCNMFIISNLDMKHNSQFHNTYQPALCCLRVVVFFQLQMIQMCFQSLSISFHFIMKSIIPNAKGAVKVKVIPSLLARAPSIITNLGYALKVFVVPGAISAGMMNSRLNFSTKKREVHFRKKHVWKVAINRHSTQKIRSNFSDYLLGDFKIMLLPKIISVSKISKKIKLC